MIQDFLSDFSCLDEQLNKHSTDIKEPIELAKSAKRIINKAIDKIYNTIINKEFNDEIDEINFFKSVFPLFLSRLFFFNCLYNIETHKPVCGKKELKKYLNTQLEILKLFFNEHKEFYNYYRSDYVFSDQLYFTRNDFDTSQNVSSIHYLIDKRFYTKHSYLIAKIISNDMVAEYIESSLFLLKNPNEAKNNINEAKPNAQKLNWTGTHISYVELFYALHEDKVFNNGDLTLAQTMELSGSAFSIKPGHFNGSYCEMKLRTNSKTKYLDSITNKILKKMNKEDD